MSTARDLMRPISESVNETDTVLEAALKLRNAHLDVLPVVRDDGGLAGILTHRDIIERCIAEACDVRRTRVADLLERTSAVTTADDVETVLDNMVSHHISGMPVVEAGHVVGVISVAELAEKLFPVPAVEQIAAILASSRTNEEQADIDPLENAGTNMASSAERTGAHNKPHTFRNLWQAFADGVGEIFDFSGTARRPRPPVPSSDQLLAKDLNELNEAARRALEANAIDTQGGGGRKEHQGDGSTRT